MSMRHLALAIALASCPATLSAQTLVKDINRTGGPYPKNSLPEMCTTSAGVTFMVATRDLDGRELWITDGTPAGTVPLADIEPGPGSGDPEDLVELPNGSVLFHAFTTATGNEPWISDGTPAGTTLLADLGRGNLGARMEEAVVVNGRAVFLADDGVSGRELWTTDGTPANTALLLDANPGPGDLSAGKERLCRVGATLFFSVFTPGVSVGWELWRTDGTAAGTMYVATITDSQSRPLRGLAAVGGRLFFAAHDPVLGLEPWISDGTAAGTFVLADVEPGAGGSNADLLAVLGPDVLFRAGDSTTGVELWKTDGTPAGTALVADLEPAVGVGSMPRALDVLGSRLLLAATTQATGREPWITDGTAAGTQSLADLEPGPASSKPATGLTVGAQTYFAATTTTAGLELWVSDGTAANTRQVIDLEPGALGSYPLPQTARGGLLLFSGAQTGVADEPWITDGTAAGTALVKDVNPDSFNSSDPSDLVRIGDKVLFAADDGINGIEPWISDGTAAGTVMLLDLRPGQKGSAPRSMAAFDDRVYFSASDGVNGAEPWVTDGTAAGTRLLRDINRGKGSSTPADFTRLGGLVVFTARTAEGQEPWVTDGTPGGTRMLADIASGWPSSAPFALFENGGLVYFGATDPVLGAEPYCTDGTPAGTFLLRDVAHGRSSSLDILTEFHGIGNLVCFNAIDNNAGRELFRSDGTPSGTTLVLDINPGGRGSMPHDFLEFNGVHYFAASSGNGSQDTLWRTDGTAAGTVPTYLPCKNAWFLPGVTRSAFYAVSNDLWRSDGTNAGTYIIHPGIQPGRYGLRGFTPGSGNKFLYDHVDATLGREVWRTDGTVAGTSLLVDVNAGAASSDPDGFVRVGNRVFFAADDGIVGRELHMLRMAFLDEFVAEPYGTGAPGSGGATPGITTGGDPSVRGFDRRLYGALANAPALLAVSDRRAFLDLGNGAMLLVAPPFVVLPFTTDAAGGVAVPVPAGALPQGAEFHAQWFVRDPAGSVPGGWSATPGLEVVVGS